MSDGYREDAATDASSVWIRSLPAWHVSFAVLLALCAALMFLVAPVGVALACAGLMGVLGLGYAVFGVRAARDRDPESRWTYLAIAVAVCVAATWLVPSAGVLLFLLFPQSWLLAERERDGVLATFALVAACAVGPALGGATSTSDWRDAAPSLVVGGAFSIVLGIYILRVIDQSRERAELLAELTAAQDALATAHHEAGVVAERQRLAAEIHDTLAQGFTSIAMQAEAALAGPVSDSEADRLLLIARTARDNLAEARSLVSAFSPPPLAEATLCEAVRRVATRFQDETGVQTVVHVEGTLAGMPRDHEVVALRAVQEALANIRKHAHASRVSVRLSRCLGVLAVEVQDDGVGCAEPLPADRSDAIPAGSGFGIAAMTKRVREVGGDVHLTSAAGEGTRVRVVIPGGAQVHDG